MVKEMKRRKGIIITSSSRNRANKKEK